MVHEGGLIINEVNKGSGGVMAGDLNILMVSHAGPAAWNSLQLTFEIGRAHV